MKLVRFGDRDAEKPGILTDDGIRRDCSAHFLDWDRNFFNNGGLQALEEVVDASLHDLPEVPREARWGSCVARPGKVLCIGLNYSDHAAESGMAVPKEPVLFMKGSNTVVGPYDDVLIPRRSQKTDWEVELGVVIGCDTRYLESKEAALECIAGFCISHDVSEREFQLERGGQWCKGKSCDTFNPLGPFLLTTDEMTDFNHLAMELKVNGVVRQKGNTSTMVFDPLFLVHYCSQFMTLEAGDVLSTGTPPGVGLGMKPPTFLKAGDVVELSVDRLGAQRQTFKNA